MYYVPKKNFHKKNFSLEKEAMEIESERKHRKVKDNYLFIKTMILLIPILFFAVYESWQ